MNDPIIFGERFDLHQRYSVSAGLLARIFADDECSVLEVGANVHGALGRRLPNAKVLNLDLEIPSELAEREDFVQGDALNMDFADDSFDAVVAIDVLEHIVPEDRERLMTEMARVSSGPILLAFPNGDNRVGDVEQVANTVHRAVHGEDNRWLKEHLENGCPSAIEVTDFMKDQLGLIVASTPSGFLPWWSFMMNVEFTFKGRQEMGPWLDTLHHYYNHYVAPHDRREPAYRTVIIGSTTEVDPLPESDPEVGSQQFDLIKQWVGLVSPINERLALGSLTRLSRRVGEYITVADQRNGRMMESLRQSRTEVLQEVRRTGEAIEIASQGLQRMADMQEEVRRTGEAIEIVSQRFQELAEVNASSFETLNALHHERMTEADKRLVEANQATEDLRSQLQTVEAQLGRERYRRREIETSETYRFGRVITAPIRFFVRLFRSLRR